MPMIQAIETEYKGYRFRSRLEARWAVFFDAMGIEWEYEPEGIVLYDGTYYLPDFFLCDFNCYFEVKRKSIRGTSEENEAISKIQTGKDCDSWAGIIAFGDPMEDDLQIFCQETDDGGGGGYDAPVTIGLHPIYHKPYLLAYMDRRERSFLTSLGDGEDLPMVTTEYGKYKYEDFVDASVMRSRKKARQARFEHGEMLKVKEVSKDA